MMNNNDSRFKNNHLTHTPFCSSFPKKKRKEKQIKLHNRSRFISQMSQNKWKVLYKWTRIKESKIKSNCVVYCSAYLDNILFFFSLINKTFTSLFKLSRFWIDNAFSENVLSFYVNIYVYLPPFAAHQATGRNMMARQDIHNFEFLSQAEETCYYWWKWEYVKRHTQSM